MTVRLLLVAALVALSGCTAAMRGSATRDASLTVTRDFAPERHVIVSVPLEQRTEDDRYHDRLAARFGAKVVAVWPLTAIEVLCLVIEVPQGYTARDLSDALRADPDILTSAPMADYRVFSMPYSDELVPAQRALRDLNILPAHRLATGRGVRVAVIDSGVQADHPDLRRKVALYRDFTGEGGGRQVAERHGTAIAAIIGADAGNGVGMVGVAPGSDLMALRACWTTGNGRRETCNTFSLARALNYSLENDAALINMSLGGPRDALLSALLDRAAEQGIPVVAAYSGDPATSFPATHETVIAASDRSPPIAMGIVQAPGADVLSARPDSQYDFFSGPSVAVAHVSGVIALLMERAPGMTRRKVERLLTGAQPRGTAGRRAMDVCALLLGNRTTLDDPC